MCKLQRNARMIGFERVDHAEGTCSLLEACPRRSGFPAENQWESLPYLFVRNALLAKSFASHSQEA
jgi:hypothetical protein